MCYADPVRYWLGLGSNLGDRLATLRSGADAFAVHGTIVARSMVFASSAVGGPPQPSFLNAAMILDCDLDGRDLLHVCHDVERAHGRFRERENVRWGPRTLDVDILLVGERGEQLVRVPDLIVPHSRLHERAFALAPLIDLDPALVHPSAGRPLKALLYDTHNKGHAVAPTGDRL
jgi:2-amino-4-hydroxy-6-hydroxymethyldihydropteridine diphosphokinase